MFKSFLYQRSGFFSINFSITDFLNIIKPVPPSYTGINPFCIGTRPVPSVLIFNTYEAWCFNSSSSLSPLMAASLMPFQFIIFFGYAPTTMSTFLDHILIIDSASKCISASIKIISVNFGSLINIDTNVLRPLVIKLSLAIVANVKCRL